MALERSDRLRLLEIAAMAELDPEDLIPFTQELERYILEGDQYVPSWEKTLPDEETLNAVKKQQH